VQLGDIITAIDGMAVVGNGDLTGILLAKPPGTQVQVTVKRGSTQLQIAVTLGERPAG
jgi:S1-C subfamily serine protease